MATAIKPDSPINFERLFAASPNPYLLISCDLTIIGVNEAFLQIAGLVRDKVIDAPLCDTFPSPPGEPRFARLRGSLERVLAERVPDTLSPVHLPMPIATDSGVIIADHYWSMTNTPVLDEHGKVLFVLQSITAVSSGATAGITGDEHVPLSNTQGRPSNQVGRHHLRHLFEHTPGFTCILKGSDHVFELANEAYYRLVGHRELLGKPARTALPDLDGQNLFELLDQVYSTGEPYIGRGLTVMFQAAPGAPLVERHVDFIYQPVIEADGSVSGIFVQGQDVSESYQLAQEISYRASHDPVTGLANRQQFEQRLAGAIEETSENRATCSLLYLDLDQFKVINDTCGHAAGDKLLRLVSQLMQERLRADDMLARLGGDEFGILLRACPAEQAEGVAEDLRELINKAEFCWQGRRFGLSISIGVACFDGSSSSYEEVLSAADSACHLAKDKGRNRVHVHHSDDTELSTRLREMDWVGRLRDALQENRLVLYAQRIQALGTHDNEFDRREILVRLKEIDGSIVPPMAFIPAAERYNLMPLIDRHVFSAALKHLSHMPMPERERTIFAINLSGTTLSDESFLQYVKDAMIGSNISTRQICFEVTETAAVANLADTGRMMRELRSLGFMFALDDFGTGMSSLSYLKCLPVDFLKIDGVFVKNILEDAVDCTMVEAIATVARAMGIKTVAEFVENDAVARKLHEIGIDYAQGYGIHVPEPV